MIASTRRPASALLITVLTMAAFASVSLLAAEAFLTSSRAHSQEDAGLVAMDEARSGIQEGLLRYDKVLLPAGTGQEYGDTRTDIASNSTYSLAPLRRGFTDSPTCFTPSSDLAPDNPTNDPNPPDIRCPYYDMAIRNTVTIDDTTVTSYRFGWNLAQAGALSQLLIRQGATFSLTLVSSSNASIKAHVCYASATNCIADMVLNRGTQVIFPGTQSGNDLYSLNLSAASGGSSSSYLEVKVASGITTDHFSIQKGFTTIESTGHAGGVQKKLVVNIWPSSILPSINEHETNLSYDSGGCLPALNPVQASVCTSY